MPTSAVAVDDVVLHHLDDDPGEVVLLDIGKVGRSATLG